MLPGKFQSSCIYAWRGLMQVDAHPVDLLHCCLMRPAARRRPTVHFEALGGFDCELDGSARVRAEFRP